VVATALHICVDRGRLDYDDRVAEHWPEFGRNGKEDITVRQVLCHEAGLYDVASFLRDPDMVLEWDAMVAGIEAMAPAFEPGTANGYHAVTFGFLVGELVRRVSGLGISEFIQREIAEPLGLDGCHVGLPRDQHGRLVQILPPTGRDARALLDDPGAMVRLAEALGLTVRPDLIVAALPPTLLEAHVTPEWVEAPMPSGNGCFTARSLARMYAALANGGEVDGIRLVSEKTVARATEVQNDRPDLVIAFPMMWRLGYHGVITTAGAPEQAFGHFGFGGSGAWGDPERELSVALTLNALGSALAGDNRLLELGGAAMRAAEEA
jgi:CubicO group peptidase (beta-lactamase class C family)